MYRMKLAKGEQKTGQNRRITRIGRGTETKIYKKETN